MLDTCLDDFVKKMNDDAWQQLLDLVYPRDKNIMLDTNIQDEQFIVPLFYDPIHPEAKAPTKAHDDDLGWDIYVVPDEQWRNRTWSPSLMGYEEHEMQFTLHPGQIHKFKTGIKVAAPNMYGFLLRDKSGLANYGIHHLAGCIEGTFRGEWEVILVNLGQCPYTFKSGDKIIQAVLTQIIPARMNQSNMLGETKRGANGFGSTGR